MSCGLEGMTFTEFAAIIIIRSDFLEVVLKSLQKHGYIEKKGDLYRMKVDTLRCNLKILFTPTTNIEPRSRFSARCDGTEPR